CAPRVAGPFILLHGEIAVSLWEQVVRFNGGSLFSLSDFAPSLPGQVWGLCAWSHSACVVASAERVGPPGEKEWKVRSGNSDHREERCVSATKERKNRQYQRRTNCGNKSGCQ
ncbi:hypothetical protein KUCAC02_035551, partial [Chaenocephalus aceratus]